MKPWHGLEFIYKFKTTSFKKGDIWLAVGYEFLFEIKWVSLFHLVFIRIGHTFWVVIGGCWQGSHIVLMVGCVEQVRKETFLEYRETKGTGKGWEWHWEEGEQIFERDLTHFEG